MSPVFLTEPSSTRPAKECDLFLDEHTLPCGDQRHQVALANRRAGAPEWSPIVRGNDGGGMRDFLDGQPIHCGTGLELQTIEYRSDDYGEYTVRLETAVHVRYEMAWGGDRKAVLYTVVGGHVFHVDANDWMRFRWTVRR